MQQRERGDRRVTAMGYLAGWCEEFQLHCVLTLDWIYRLLWKSVIFLTGREAVTFPRRVGAFRSCRFPNARSGGPAGVFSKVD